jgi:hypothetical protein
MCDLGVCDSLSTPHENAAGYCPNWRPVEPVVEIVGGAPHGFGVWVEGKYHPVDIGALGTVITDLQQQLAAATAALVAIAKIVEPK